MGIEDYLLTSTVNGILAQRLVRVLCGNCCEPYDAPSALINELQLHRFATSGPITLYRAKGCQQCNGTGYYGRTSIYEFLVMSDLIRSLVLRGADAKEIEKAVIQGGASSMYEDGMRKVLRRVTTLEEVLRVTREG
jgi:general secretion pathway protein E